MAQDNKCPQPSESYSQTRRRLLKLSAAGMATSSLAGCSGRGGDEGGSGDGGTGDGGSGGSGSDDVSGAPQVINKTWKGQTWFNPEQIQWNPWGLHFPYNPSTWLYEAFGAMHALATPPDDQLLYLYDKKTWDGNTLTLKLKDGFKWHNGDDVTAGDLYTQLKIEKWARANTVMSFAYDEWNLMESVSQKSDLAVEIKAPGMNHDILERVLTNGGGHGPKLLANRNVFKKHLEAIEDATTEKERKSAIEKLRQRKMKEPIGCGPFKFKEQTSSRIKLERFGEHPAADHINWSGGEFLFFPDNQAYTSAIMSGNIDGTWGTRSRSKIRSYPKHMKTWLIKPVYGCWSLNFNHKHEFFGNRTVRQALAHAIDRKEVSRLYSRMTTQPRKKITGMHNIAASDPKEWLGDKYGKYRAYGTDTQKAASLMREAGYSKSGKWWTDSNGKKLSFTMIASPVNKLHRAIASQLKDFGIDLTLQSLEGATFSNRIQSGNFEIIASQPEGWLPHPYFALQKVLGFRALWVGDNQYPAEVEVPMPVGNYGGSTQTLNWKDLMSQLEQTQNRSKEKEIVQKLSWIVNVDIPQLGLLDYGDDMVMSNQGWEFPTQGLNSKQAKNPIEYNADKINKHLTAKWPIEWLTLRSGEFKATK